MFEPGISPSVARSDPVVWPRRETTDALLTAAGRGDPDAFAAFYDATAPMLLGMVRGVLDRPGRTERVVEEIYLVLWRCAAAFDPIVRSADAMLLDTARRVLVGPVREAITPTGTQRRADGGPPLAGGRR